MTNDRKDNKDESAKKPDATTSYSINEPGLDDPQAFKVPEDHTATTPETLERDYPDGYAAPETEQSVKTHKQAKADEATEDPDELEDEIDQAKEEGDFKSSGYKPTHKSPTTKRK